MTTTCRISSDLMEIFGENRRHITIADLPPPDEDQRWVPRKKAAVVAGIQNGLLSTDEACIRYKISQEELAHWERSFGKYGMKGLQVTKTQDLKNKKIH